MDSGAPVACPEPESLAAFTRGELEASGRSAIESHLDACSSCARVVAELVRIFSSVRMSADAPVDPLENDPGLEASSRRRFSESHGGPRTEAPEGASLGADEAGESRAPLTPGSRLDRYHVLEVVGRGGMGTVYAAYDPDLDRKVAIKVLHDGGADHGGARGQRRLLREAQAIARLSHPNVITVHEARLSDGLLFLSMEFVEGSTLARWMAGGRRDHDAILTMFRDIGRGLGAAHAAGLVHRDVKPDNVLIGADGRPRVTDFGLARPAEGRRAVSDDVDLEASDRPISQDRRPLDATITGVGALVGTPAYMSPEQFRREPATPASDQFSYCVALFEALWGARPFRGATLLELATAVVSGAIVEPACDPPVPRWLRQVVLRGLALDPASRWPAMDVLVARLEPPRRVRRISWLGGGAVAIAAGTIVANISPTDPCARSDLAAVEVWSGQTRDRVAGALVGDGTAFSRDTTARVTERLDHYAALLGAEQRDACEDYHRGGQSHEALDLRGACLDERLDELSALIGAFATADDEVRRNAVTATDALTPVTICSDVEALKMRLPLPNDPAVRLRVSELERTRAAVEAQFRAGRYREGLDAANALVAAAREVDHAATVARVLRVRGELLRRLARHDELVVDLREAWVMALGAADEATAAAAVVDLAHALALARSFEEAQLRVTEAEAMVQRLQRYDPVGASALGTRLDEARGLLALRQHRYDDAVSFYERSLAVTERETGADSLRTSQALSSLASARLAQSAWEDSLALFERVLAIRIRHLGPAHPEVAQTHNSIGLTLKNMDRLDEAEAELDEARAALAATLGPEDSSLHMIDVNLAELYFRQRRYSRCAEQWSAVLGIEGVASAAHVFELHRVGRYAEALFQTSRVAEARLVADVARRRMGAFEADADALAVARSLDRLDQLLLSDGTFGRPEPATAGDKAP